jgi:hypothetical protein
MAWTSGDSRGYCRQAKPRRIEPTCESVYGSIATGRVESATAVRSGILVASVLEEMHNAGKGIVGMKVLGEGRFTTPERKNASLRYVLGLGAVNAFIIGFENAGHIDDLLKRTADAIAFLKA